MKEKALIVDDDRDLVQSLKKLVLDLGYEPETAYNGAEGLEKGLANDYSLVLLDLDLPELEGTEVCRKLRESKKDVPIIMLTANGDETHTVLLLELGADDYVTKPFRNMELKARIKAVLRRSSRFSEYQGTEALRCKDLLIDFDKRRVFRNEEPIELTAREFDILSILARRAGKPLSRDEINEQFYGADVAFYDKSITVHIARLRAKIEPDPDKPVFILTARGVGYYFTDEF